MKQRILLLLGIATILASNVIALAPDASAQSANPDEGGQALEIAPPVINLSLKPGQRITTQVSLRDVSSGPLLVTGEVNDFVAAGEDGTPKILIDEEESANNPFSLRKWISPLPRILLEPREIKNMPITITVPANAAPGGYYAVIRFTGTPPELEGTGVSLSASLGSLLLVRVEGEAKESMEIVEFSVGKGDKTGTLFESAPVEFKQRIKNTGTVHQQPSGQVAVSDMFGNKVAVVNINLPPGNVLPNSIRKFSQPLDSSVIGNKILFGKYTAELTVKYGSTGETLTQKTTFWIIPYTLIAVAAIALVIGFIALRSGVKRYNQHIIKSAQKGSKNTKKRR